MELECAGVSVSCRGFVALLVRKGIGHEIPKPPNSVQLMRGADPASELPPDLAKEFVLPVLVTSGGDDDTDAATSARAQTMLQLLQNPPCDMGIQLPYTALGEVTKSADAVLGAVLIGKARFEDGSKKKFIWESTILAGKGMDQSAVDIDGDEHEAWQCLALARRYETYGCRVFATSEAIAGASGAKVFTGDSDDEAKVTFATVRTTFLKMQTVTESRAIATEAREKFLWRPFAAATSEDVPVAEEDDDGDDTNT